MRNLAVFVLKICCWFLLLSVVLNGDLAFARIYRGRIQKRKVVKRSVFLKKRKVVLGQLGLKRKRGHGFSKKGSPSFSRGGFLLSPLHRRYKGKKYRRRKRYFHRRKHRRRWRRRKYRHRRWRRRRRFHYLTRIRYESKRNYTRIVLVVDGTVHIEQGEVSADPIHHLPMRLYIDLTPCIPLRKWRYVALLLGDERVSRIRVARNTLRTTRVVMDLKGYDRSRITVLSDPLRIVVDFSTGPLPPRPDSFLRLPSGHLKVVKLKRTLLTRRHRRHRGAGDPYVLRYKGKLRLPFPFQVKSIVIDPGHGGREEGTVGLETGLQEKVVTLDIAKRVVKKLKKRLKLSVFLTRDRDRTLSLFERARIVQEKKADILVSIHINAHPSRHLNGVSTYILHWNDRFRAARLLRSNPLVAIENQGVSLKRFRDVSMILSGLQVQNNTVISKLLAVAIQRKMMQSIHRKYQMIRDLGVRRGLFYLLFASGVPSVLVEASYLSNRMEEKLLGLSDYRDRIAEGITDGIVRFVELTHRMKKSTN